MHQLWGSVCSYDSSCDECISLTKEQYEELNKNVNAEYKTKAKKEEHRSLPLPSASSIINDPATSSAQLSLLDSIRSMLAALREKTQRAIQSCQSEYFNLLRLYIDEQFSFRETAIDDSNLHQQLVSFAGTYHIFRR